MVAVSKVSTTIDTPLLIVGGGPAALIIGTVAAGYSLGSLIVDHESLGSDDAVELDDEAVALLKPHGVINVLKPYATSMNPFVITAALFEKVLKHHCVVNMNITLYDGMDLRDLKRDGDGAHCSISDGHNEWAIKADRLVDTTKLPTDLNGAIKKGAAIAGEILSSIN